MATTKDELWSLEQRSRGLAEFLSELRIIWNDSAAHEISTRYLVPRSDDDQRMQQALADQQSALEELHGHVTTVMELASAAEELSQNIAQLLRETLREVSTANGYYQSFSEFNNNALNLFPQIQEQISQAGSSCSGISSASEHARNEDNGTNKSSPVAAVGSTSQSSVSGGKYGYLQDPPNVGMGKEFSPSQIEAIIKENMKMNGGVVRSDKSGITLVRPQKSQRGVTPSPNEWQIDHIIPRSKGGTNSFANAQVLSRQENRAKWDG